MGKLTIRVHKLKLLRVAGLGVVQPRVTIVVDSTYKFQTRGTKHAYEINVEETFCVGNTHRQAIIEVFVSTVGRPSEVFPGIGSVPGAITGDNNDDVVLGRCYISIQRLVHGQPKTRTYILGAVSTTSDEVCGDIPAFGVAGTVTMTLESDSLGESPASFHMQDQLEKDFTNRLKRFLLQYDPIKLQVLDLLISTVRDPKEVRTAAESLPEVLSTSSQDDVLVKVGSSDNTSRLSFYQGSFGESFEQVLQRLCRQYGGVETPEFQVVLHIDGCTNLDKKALRSKLFASNKVHVLVRTELQDFVTEARSLQNTVVWSEENEVVLDVINPSSFVIQICVMGKTSSTYYEIGRTMVSVAPLASDHSSARQLFLCLQEGNLIPMVNGIVHFTMRPLNFGLTPMEMVDYVDEFYDRLGKFFKRYDQVRIPQIDMLIHARLGELEDFMQDLVVEYGREPGSMRLLITIESVFALHRDAETELDDTDVMVIISMGSAVIRTKSRGVRRFAATEFKESYLFDVVRETDMIRIEVVLASDESVVFGRIDFTCLNIQRGVPNYRKLYLVGNSGTSDAYLSGLLDVGIQSDDIGHDYEVDVGLESMLTGRLRRYAYSRLPENLHRVNTVLATVFDIETFMAQMSMQYGPEDPTYAVYFTIIGCRQLPSKLYGISPYVVARVGIDTYHTRFVKDSTEPDYFEYCEFFFDRTVDNKITLVVMDHSEIGKDDEIGRADIALSDVKLGQHYQDFLPLTPPGAKGDSKKRKEIGSVGFKFMVMDLKLVDKTRVRLCEAAAGDKVQKVPHRRNFGDRKSLSTQRAETDTNASEPAEDEHGAGWDLSSRWNTFRHNLVHSSVAMGRAMFARGPSSNEAKSSNAATQPPSRENSMDSDGGSQDLHSRSPSINQDYGNDAPSRFSPRRQATLNLMDEGIIGVETFCLPTDATSTANQSETESVDQPGDVVQPMVDKSSDQDKTKRLRVRVVCCKDLLSNSNQPPNPYLLLATVHETRRTRIEYSTFNPQYNEEFVFRVEDPKTDYLNIIVLADTPFGTRNLGCCVLSLNNVQCGQAFTRWVSFVINANLVTAEERGSICISMLGEKFGLDYQPSAYAEERLRERTRRFLRQSFPRLLHRLEWYVGEYSLKDGQTLSRVFGELYAANDIQAVAANIKLEIKDITNLIGELYLLEGSCRVKAKINGSTVAKTRAVTGAEGVFRFNESFEFTVPNAAAASIRFSVTLNKREKVGECYVSFADIHKSIPQERQHILVGGVRSSNPHPSGYINVSLMSDDWGSTAEPPTAEEEARYRRLKRFVYYYLPQELATVDVTYATTINMEAYLQRLVEEHGPEPGEYKVNIMVKKCYDFRDDGQLLNPFFIIRRGLDAYKTEVVHGKAEFVFNQAFNMIIGLPQSETVDLILANALCGRQVELGRAQIPMHLLRSNKKVSLRLLVLRQGSSRDKEVVASVDVDLFTRELPENSTHCNPMASSMTLRDFTDDGSRSAQQQQQQRAAAIGCSEVEVLSQSPDQTAPASTNETRRAIAETTTGAELSPPQTGPSKEVAAGREKAENSGDVDPNLRCVRVKILGFDGLNLGEELVLVRISVANKVLLRTKGLPAEQLAKASLSIELEDVSALNEVTATLKLSVSRLIGSESICYCDFCFARCPPAKVTEKRLRLYDVNSKFLGFCRIQIHIPKLSFAETPRPGFPSEIVEVVMDDVASIIASYDHKDVRRLDLALYHSLHVRHLHRMLRSQLAPSVVATVYVAVSQLDVKEKLPPGCIISASVGGYTAEVAEVSKHPVPPNSTMLAIGGTRERVRGLRFPLLRVDIAVTGRAAVMTLRVMTPASSGRPREVGRTVVSLRALLSSRVYDMSETVRVPLVAVNQDNNRALAALSGSLSFFLVPPVFESYPLAVQFAPAMLTSFSRPYVRHYFDRICRLLQRYDANSLTNIHEHIYESFVAERLWVKGLPQYLSELCAKWGREKDPSGPVPELEHRDERQQPLFTPQQQLFSP